MYRVRTGGVWNYGIFDLEAWNKGTLMLVSVDLRGHRVRLSSGLYHPDSYRAVLHYVSKNLTKALLNHDRLISQWDEGKFTLGRTHSLRRTLRVLFIQALLSLYL